jgi:hypothetical protein
MRSKTAARRPLTLMEYSELVIGPTVPRTFDDKPVCDEMDIGWSVFASERDRQAAWQAHAEELGPGAWAARVYR